MKLQNKKTGKIIDAVMTGENEIEFQERGSLDRYTYSSLAELNKEWEDYKEPEIYYRIDSGGFVHQSSIDEYPWSEPAANSNKAIGNYFETEEEAEKVVEKLKALKRLKDKGFRFTGWEDLNTLDPEDSLLVNRDVVDGECVIGFRMSDYADCTKDLDLLFGGEE